MRILISAGDVSGDIVGALLTREILAQRRGAMVLGIGGPRMAAAGARVGIRTSHLGVAGVTEVLDRLPEFIRTSWAILRSIRDERPSVAVLIGNDLFSVILGRWLRRQRIPTISYFPPPTWMWGPLVRVFVNSFDAVLASFPEEHDVYQRASDRVCVQFVGHYLADTLRPRTAESIRSARVSLGIEDTARVASLMPGSRQHEVRRLLPVMVQAAKLMLARDPDIRFLVPVAEPCYRDSIERELALAGIADRVAVVNGPNHGAMIAADVVILASGTASLEATLVGVPMIILYKVSAITALIARSMIRAGMIEAEVIGLPNLILGRMAVPELTQERAEGAAVAAAAVELLESPQRRQKMVADLAEAAGRVSGGGALRQAASVILGLAPYGDRH